MTSRKWSDDDLKVAIITSFSLIDVLKKLGLGKGNSNYSTIKKFIVSLNLDTTHFKLPANMVPNYRINLEDILIQNSSYTNTSSLKRKLLFKKLLKYTCYACGIVEWQGKRLSLQLDHINGINTDNRIENLRLLCPNCHSLTSTFCRKINEIK